MHVVDANVLLYAVDEESPLHDAAKTWLDGAVNGAEAVGFVWPVVLAFLRLATHPRVFHRPLSLDEAVERVEAWLAHPTALVLEPTERHLGVLHGLLAPLGTAANLVNDAHLAALAIEHGAGVVSFDRDFARFTGVRWMAPPGAG